MTELNPSHSPNHTPPQTILPVLEKIKACYKSWLPIRRSMPRTEQFGIGGKVDALCLELLETVRLALYSKPQEKVPLLEKAILRTDSLRFFLQLCWESKLIANNNFEMIGKQVEEVGKILGGWKKGIITKTSPPVAGKKEKE